jgi:hypothetical protein
MDGRGGSRGSGTRGLGPHLDAGGSVIAGQGALKQIGQDLVQQLMVQSQF